LKLDGWLTSGLHTFSAKHVMIFSAAKYCESDTDN